MIIESIQLENFRNYDSLRLKFDEGTNIFYGDNAQGKTNILESVYLCGTTKSHKGSKDKEMIRFLQDEAHIRMELNRNGSSYKIDMHLKRNKAKGIAINGIPIRKASELLGIGNFVFFSPEDLNIIKDGPGERRRFLDLELCQLNKIYLYNLSNYNKIVNQRNKLLKEIHLYPEYREMLDIWDEQMAEYGARIIRDRERFVKILNEIVSGIHKKLSGNREELSVSYEKSVSAESFGEMLKKNRDRDIRFKMTLLGPHRDDLSMMIRDADIRRYGSQGQQRTAALALKLAEIELVKREIKDTPVLLLDDVLSELDRNRQHYLLDSIHDIQTLITCTGLDDFIENQFQINKVFHVVEGNIK
ncbi:MAG: DNA replication/repair protein RecF [Blautia sp.]|nr:DNA replication/repair protein RecF [Blautia sp.]MDY4516316.1 DNA replication/repair protein RecF [Lachnospiraceae bacterium]